MNVVTLRIKDDGLIELLRKGAERNERTLNKEIVHRLRMSFPKPYKPKSLPARTRS